MIVKVQVPLNTDAIDSNAPALIYDQERTFTMFAEVHERLRRVLAGRDKAFFYARWVGEKTPNLELEREAPWQDW